MKYLSFRKENSRWKSRDLRFLCSDLLAVHFIARRAGILPKHSRRKSTENTLADRLLAKLRATKILIITVVIEAKRRRAKSLDLIEKVARSQIARVHLPAVRWVEFQSSAQLLVYLCEYLSVI